MKYFLLIIIIFPSLIFSQGLLINAGNLRVEAGNVVIAANGNWTNNGTVNCVSGSTVNFAGTALQTIQGTTTTAFSNLTVNNTGGGIVIGRDISTLGTLLITQGSVDLKNSIVDLSTTGTVSGETETNRLKGTDGFGVDGLGTGTIRATRVNPSGNVAGLGFSFTPGAALGNTIIIRGHERQAGSGTFSGNYSALRYYELQPTTMSALTVDNYYYWGGVGNPELNGHIEANLEVFQQVNYGGPTYWEPRASVVTAGSDFISSTTVNNAVAGAIRITLGSTTTPLPIELISFKGKCYDSGIELLWQTASENNNDYFEVEKSPDGENFVVIAQTASQGNSNTPQNYSTIDDTPFNKINYYRLHQFDKDGRDSYSEIISLICNSDNVNEDIFPISPSRGSVDVIIQGISGKTYQLGLTNVLGQFITKKEITLSENQQTIKVYDTNIANGIYYVTMQTDKKKMGKPVLINN